MNKCKIDKWTCSEKHCISYNSIHVDESTKDYIYIYFILVNFGNLRIISTAP